MIAPAHLRHVHTRRTKVFFAIACLLSVALISTPAAAYVLEGPRWSGQPGPGVCCASITYRIEGLLHSSDGTAIDNGAFAWTTSAALVNLSKNNTVYNINTYDVDISSVGWDGTTSYTYYVGSNGKQYFNNGANLRVNYHYLKGYSGPEAQSVAAHEFGHALGLDHVTGCHLMNAYTTGSGSRWSSCGVNTPTTDDANGVNALY